MAEQRPIKLPRVWDKIDKEMMSPAKWEENYVGGGNKKIGLYIYRSKKDPTQHSSLDWILRHPESFDVMWPTGLCDKHGKEIYEGDIVKFSTNGKDWETAVIEFQVHTYNAGYYPNKSANASCYWEIIGNVHSEEKGD